MLAMTAMSFMTKKARERHFEKRDSLARKARYEQRIMRDYKEDEMSNGQYMSDI